MKEKIKQIVIDSLMELKECNDLIFELTEDTILLGENSILDSFDFVSLVANIEEKISESFDKNISIVSEKAFSKKYSPFKTVDRITDYLLELITEA